MFNSSDRLNRKDRQPKESKVMKVVNAVGTAIMLNLMFLIACIPVVTIGPAMSGLYTGVRFIIRGDGCIKGFWEGFRTHFLRMLIAGIIGTAATAYAGFGVFTTAYYQQELDLVPLILGGIMTLLVMMICASMPIVNIYVPSTTLRWLQNSVTLTVRAPHIMLCVGAAYWLPIVLVIVWTMWAFFGLLIFIAAYFVLVAFIATLFLKYHLIRIRNEELAYSEGTSGE